MKNDHLTPYDWLNVLNNLELLSSHSEILTQLRLRGAIRTKNNPVGDYAEWSVSDALGMTLLSNSPMGVDAIDADGLKVWIKTRRVMPDNTSRQLSVLRNYESADFGYLTAVIFDETYSTLDVYKTPREVIRDYARHSDHANVHIVNLKGTILADPRVTFIKENSTAEGSTSVDEAAA